MWRAVAQAFLAGIYLWAGECEDGIKESKYKETIRCSSLDAKYRRSSILPKETKTKRT